MRGIRVCLYVRDPQTGFGFPLDSPAKRSREKDIKAQTEIRALAVFPQRGFSSLNNKREPHPFFRVQDGFGDAGAGAQRLCERLPAEASLCRLQGASFECRMLIDVGVSFFQDTLFGVGLKEHQKENVYFLGGGSLKKDTPNVSISMQHYTIQDIQQFNAHLTPPVETTTPKRARAV